MKILAVDAATEACSAALLRDGALVERYEVIGRGHAGRLLPMADELLNDAGVSIGELDAVAFGRGPGGFTGLRIAAGVAQGLAAGSNRPVLPVSNLAAVAAAAARVSGSTRVLVCMDARMGQVYWAAYDCSGEVPVAVTDERLADPASVAVRQGECVMVRRRSRLVRVSRDCRAPCHADFPASTTDFCLGLPTSRESRPSNCLRERGSTRRAALPVYLRNDVVHRR